MGCARRDIMSGMANEIIERLLASMGGKYSRELGIDLTGCDRAEIFRWFLAAKLFGARISAEIAMRTFREFERRGVVTPERILATGWDGLVSILDAGGYVRYDFSSATRLLAISEALIRSYGSDLNALHELARDSTDLERLVKGLGAGIGDVMVNIFLRELRTVWPKARPILSPLALLASGHLELAGPEREPLASLERLWSKDPVAGSDFCDFEAALVRLGKDYCRKGKHDLCPLRDICGKGDVGSERSGARETRQ
jgi:endonuclease III